MTPSSDLPLFAWTDARRATRDRHRRILRTAASLGLGVVALGLTIVAPPRPILLWNASPSVPIGLYRISSAGGATLGDLVIVHMPGTVRTLAAQRRYLPATVPLLKRIAAIGGMRVCGRGAIFTVAGRTSVVRLRVDAHGRFLPRWDGCRRLAAAEILLLSTDRSDSFDGRYFGPISRSDLIGKAIPLWLR